LGATKSVVGIKKRRTYTSSAKIGAQISSASFGIEFLPKDYKFWHVPTDTTDQGQILAPSSTFVPRIAGPLMQLNKHLALLDRSLLLIPLCNLVPQSPRPFATVCTPAAMLFSTA
jgi:hypothetical protein